MIESLWGAWIPEKYYPGNLKIFNFWRPLGIMDDSFPTPRNDETWFRCFVFPSIEKRDRYSKEIQR